MDLHSSASTGAPPSGNTIPLYQEEPPAYEPTSTTLEPVFYPDRSLILKSPPALDPTWLAHEESINLKTQQPITDPRIRQTAYSKACKDRNTALLNGRDSHLNHGIKIHDTHIESLSIRSHRIPIRAYNPLSCPDGPPTVFSNEPETSTRDVVIYYHGGGLYVGDLDSEDLTCRRMVKELDCTVYSVAYRLLPEFTADSSVHDAMTAFSEITRKRRARKWVVMGSSSGAQLAAMVSQRYRQFTQRDTSTWARGERVSIHGVLLRGPVTCDATDGGVNLPPRFRECHTSMSPEFHTSLLSAAALTASNRTREQLPLEANLAGLPRHWIQVCTNDIYYSDGILYGEALREAGVEVKMDVIEGWPHTFWLKAPELKRAFQAEADMIEGLRWLLSHGLEKVEQPPQVSSRYGNDESQTFVPFSTEEFEKKFNSLE